MNIIFRADSSSLIGTGHIMRDLVLANKYLKNGHKIIFATQNLNGNINNKITESGFELILLNSNSFEEFNEIIKNNNINMVVIDSYNIDYKFEKKLKKNNSKIELLCFDDIYEKHYCDIILNHNIGANEKKYKGLVPKNCKLKCGSKFTLLRDEFIKEKKKKTIFLAMGGADHSNINIKILKLLKNVDNIVVNVVTTSANKNILELQNFVKQYKWINLHINSLKLANLMKKSDFAIVTPSVTLNEVYYMELPFIAIKTADNQKDIYNYLNVNNYAVLNKFNKKKLLFLVKLKLENIKLINFTKLSNIEKDIIFNFRNNKLIRKWMYNKDLIKYTDHLDYIKSLKKRDDIIYFLVKKNNKYIGVIDLTSIKKDLKEAELGIYANPELKGQGKVLMESILEYSFNIFKLKIIRANVYKDNTPAVSLYKKFGFEIVQEKNNLLYMELKNENRKV